ncbi:hypothetical protein FA893_17330 [Photobacterium damselae subsp. piscicida]|nr:hypothetical protein [Photobacterium damselae]OLQ80231.1 hypothetical protein BEI67_15040 [Photobacterium damselae subsp. piscicida]TFZ63038.1 hypothetical protein E4T25_02945 [Photobacterium damselae subsp. piscicida]TJZ83688.1 hypothetical protein FA893_17330 [Photobacterium damselae subsp. piscicida]BBC40845.1 hypothetical protein PDPE_1-01685 [Photobacterium damselae subsp. piscicida]
MLFNHTRKPIIICEKSELRGRILKALELAKKVVCKRQGVKKLSHDDRLAEKARLGATKLSLFKYLYQFDDEFELNEAWLNNVYRLVDIDPKVSRNEFHQILPECSRYINITQNDARGLRTDLRLFLHCCWASKFLLLPVYFSEIPTIKLGKVGATVEYAEDAYPEIFKIIRAPFFKELDCDIDIKQYMAEASMKNFKWYAHRYVRACAAWVVEDITNELLDELAKNTIPNVPRTVGWYLALHACMPDRVRFDTEKVFVRNSYLPGIKGKLTTADFTPLELENHPAISVWIEEVNGYIDALKEKGLKSYAKYQNAIRKGMQALINSGESLPEPKNINRNQAKAMMKVLGKGIKASSYKDALYKLEGFFQYIAIIHDDFKVPVSKRLDFPISGRSKGTVKELLPEDSFAPYLSYLYGIAEWIWYMNYHHPHKDAFVSRLIQTDKTIKTNDSGFTPIFRCNDKYYPIEEIPTKICPSFRPRVNQVCGLKSCTFIPHYIHLSILMAETGIRLMALRWLNDQTYDKNVDRDLFNERSYLITKLWVNTDKSHDAWVADVSETVIGILDRQSTWKKNFLIGEDAPIYYDGHEYSDFEMIKPLFAQVDPHLEIKKSFSTVTDSSYRTTFKHILLHFSYIYSKISEHNIPPVEIHHDKDLVGNLQRVKGFIGNAKLDITPHSMRAQVVSNNITILPPSVIKKSTGHADDAHEIYYAKIQNKFLDVQKAGQEQEFRDFITPMMVDAKSKQSALQQAFAKNANRALNDFGAVSFSNHDSKETRSGMLIIKKKLDDLEDTSDNTQTIIDLLAFNSTHICPFNNECPDDIKKNAIHGIPKCGECPYSVKTVDHLPAISAKIRALTDKAAELEDIINEAKANSEDMGAYINEISLKRFYGGEISAWATTATCLDSMANNLSQKDKWLVRKPDFIRKKLTKLKSSNELTNTLVRIEEALNYQEFLTPQLKAKVTIFRNKVLAQTRQFKALLGEEPTGQKLLYDFKGIIKTICDISGIGVNELPAELARIEMNAQKALGGTLSLPITITGGRSA